MRIEVSNLVGQGTYKANDRVTVKQTILYGPHQSATSLEFWRFLSDTTVERKTARFTTAFEYQVAEERLALPRNHPRNQRALWMSAQAPLHWAIHGSWSVTVRPEFCWDREGRWTGSQQLVKAVTSTLEYSLPYRWSNTIIRLEHRYDSSRGKEGGFFSGGIAGGMPGLTPGQHLLVIGVILTLEKLP
ncbi:MAG TPA: outer membrane beta-barrel protein [Candidatus Saccharimonadales bacterium]|nr:outer membrane beta-barrel protein [Candidatus Saccharimonadales bacterium]